MALACDTHPVQNLKVLARLRQLGVAEEKVTEWAAWANREGLDRLRNTDRDEAGPFCFGDGADPRRSLPRSAACQCTAFRRRCSAFPRLLKAETAARSMPAFADAAPDKQADAE